MKISPRKPGAPRRNKNAQKPDAQKRIRANVNLTPSQHSALVELGGTTSGMQILLNAAAGAVPIARTFRADDGTWRAVWLDYRGGEIEIPEERETDAGALDEYAARLIAAHEWLAQLASIGCSSSSESWHRDRRMPASG